MYGLKRVVVTGIGVLTPAGNNIDELWTSLITGKSGIGPITLFDATEFASRIAGELKNFNPRDHFSPKDARKIDRVSQMGIVASRMAVSDSGLDADKLDPTKIGVLFGSGIGGLETMEKQHEVFMGKGPSRISPFLIPMMLVDTTAGLISKEFNCKGPNYSIVSACATGTHTIGEAARTIATGDADIILAGASEAAVTHLGVGGFAALKALSRNNDNPEKASRPFDLNRDGFVLSEGAGTLVLEEYEHAKARGANIYGEITGYGLSGDAYHMTQPAPGGEGAARSIKMAIDRAGINPENVDYYNAHGTSTKFNDMLETQALKAALGDHASKLAISSTKSITGHLLGAAGAIELAATLRAMKESVIPPTWNLETPDPDCDLDYVPNTPREADLKICLSNSLGFGGHNTTIAVQKI